MIKKTMEFDRYYFITFILKISLSEDMAETLLKKTFEGVSDLCKLLDIKLCGKKRLTYPIQKQEMGQYCTAIIKIKEDDNLQKSLDEIHRRFKAIQEILRLSVMRYDFNENSTETLFPDNLLHMKPHIDKNIEKEIKK